ncbi:MAG: efflux RND transporter permease subunit [Candidatus Omnitrophota bacterium]
MKKIAQFSLNHSLFVNLVSLFLVVAGVASVFHLRREAFPEVSYDLARVDTEYKGAAAQEVERLVTTPLEKELKQVDDIDEMSSVSRRGLSTIVLKLNPDARERRRIIDDIQSAVDRVVDLPEDSETPLVTEITSNKIPVLVVSLTGNLSEARLQGYARRLEDIILDIPGVAAVERSGWRKRQLQVEADLAKIKDYHVSLEEIMRALKQRNVALPAGSIRSPRGEFILRGGEEFHNKEEIANTVIRANDAGNLLRVRDVAVVRDYFEDEDVLYKTEGKRAISLTIMKRKSADTISVVDKVRLEVKQFLADAADKDLKARSFYDMSFYVRRRLKVLFSNGVIAFFLVCLILLFFLRPGFAFWTAAGVLIALLSTFWVMNAAGMSINLITMLGLILVLGMLVDDGIIISENVYRYREKGLSSRQAAIAGAAEVAAPVFATVCTTIAAFIPLMFVSGLLGRFIRNIPVVVAMALAASLLEAFVILPAHLADFGGGVKSGDARLKGLYRAGEAWFGRLRDVYLRVLHWALNRRYVVVGGAFILFFVCIVAARLGMRFVLFPGNGVEQFMIRAQADVGASIYRTDKMLAPVEDFVARIPSRYLDTFETEVGAHRERRSYDPQMSLGGHLAQITVYLTPSQRRESAQEIIRRLRPQLEEIKKESGFRRLYFQQSNEGPPVGKPVYVRIQGEDYSRMRLIAEEIKAYLSRLDGLSAITDDYELDDKHLDVVVDDALAGKAYVSVGDVALSLRNAFYGGVATSVKPQRAEDETDVLVRLPRQQRDVMSVFDNLVVANRRGDLIPLKDIARIQQVQRLRSVRHLDGRRAVSVSAEVDNRKITSAKVNRLLEARFSYVPHRYPGYTIKYSGENEETGKSISSLLQAFLLAFLLIFLILATQFNSLVQPLMVMLAIPLGLIGVIIAFFVHGQPLSFFALLGLAGLAGVVVNDSIVLVDFINRLRRSGVGKNESILRGAGLRLRPVILTTITTVAGIGTVAYGIGGSDPFLKPMALAVTWGLLFATALTLIIIPCVYAIVDDLKKRCFLRGGLVVNSAKA